MVSKNISAFLNFRDQAMKDYCYAQDMMSKCHSLETDLLHKLELEKLSTGERSKIATQLRDCLKDRRYWKNQVEELEPLVMMFTDSSAEDPQIAKANTAFINRLKEVLGQTRKVEAYHKDRTYKPRIIKADVEEVD